MDNQPGQKYTTSFIPKKPVAIPTTGYSKSSGPKVMTVIGMFVFLASLLLGAGVYLWKIQINSSITAQIESLKKSRAEFDNDTLAAATRLNERINVTKSLLEKHKAPSEILELLEDNILVTVRLKNLSYSTQADGTIQISGAGSAAGFKSVILQSNEMGKTGLLRDVMFADVQSTAGNLVSFSLNSLVEEKVVLYKNKFNSQFSVGENASPAKAEEGGLIFSRKLFAN